jgi:hypothetical protein
MTTIAEKLNEAAEVLTLAGALPSPVGDVARVLAAAAKIGAELAGDGRTTDEIVAAIHRAKDIGPAVVTQDAEAAHTLDERFPRAGNPTPAADPGPGSSTR